MPSSIPHFAHPSYKATGWHSEGFVGQAPTTLGEGGAATVEEAADRRAAGDDGVFLGVAVA